jgi:uncharacterized paraquat-inducible protein A
MTTTAWDRIEQEFKQWLQNAGSTADEFNELGLVDQRTLLTQFEQQKQQQQRRQATQVSLLGACIFWFHRSKHSCPQCGIWISLQLAWVGSSWKTMV